MSNFYKSHDNFYSMSNNKNNYYYDYFYDEDFDDKVPPLS